MYIKLNDNIVPNRGYVKVRDISLASGLHCLIFNDDSNNDHEGDWISPDGTTVDSSGSVPGFRTTRGPLIVRLLRTSGTPQQGIYQCVVQNSTVIPHVGLYNSGNGNAATKYLFVGHKIVYVPLWCTGIPHALITLLATTYFLLMIVCIMNTVLSI